MTLLSHPIFWFAAIFLPAVTAVAMIPPRGRERLIKLAPWTALPALLLALAGETGCRVTFSWLFFAGQFGLNPTARVFLAFTAFVWLLAAVYAVGYIKIDDTHRTRFFASFLLAMSGNFGLILAEDVFSFYFLFALMSFASFGLVIHTGTDEARRAGIVYIWLVVIGEAFVFSALLLAARATGEVNMTQMAAGIASAPQRNAILALAFLGFGVKAGALPLHVWLPLAHPVAPTPASAVLSGCMIKAGLLGWLRLFPLGLVLLPGWGSLLVSLGLTAAVAAVLVGLTQKRPKTVLAYSSISQMGVMTAALGLGLLTPEKWTALWPAVMIYAAHHALAKGALFLSVGTAGMPTKSAMGRRLQWLAVILPAAAVMGAPLTSGAAAKGLLKYAATDTVAWLIGVAAVGTVAIMVRFLFLVRPRTGQQSSPTGGAVLMRTSWTVLLLAIALLPLLLSVQDLIPLGKKGVPLGLTLTSLWPLLAGGTLCAVWLVRKMPVPMRVPEGDVLSGYLILLTGARRGVLACVERVTAWQQDISHKTAERFLDGLRQVKTIESVAQRMTRWPVFGMMFMMLVVIMFVLIRGYF